MLIIYPIPGQSWPAVSVTGGRLSLYANAVLEDSYCEYFLERSSQAVEQVHSPRMSNVQALFAHKALAMSFTETLSAHIAREDTA